MKNLPLSSVERLYELNARAGTAVRQDPTRAEALARRAWRLARRLRDGLGEATALGHLGNALMHQDRAEDALSVLTRAIDAAREVDSPSLVAGGLWSMGHVCTRLSDLMSAQAKLQAALVMSEHALPAAARVQAWLELAEVQKQIGNRRDSALSTEAAVAVGPLAGDEWAALALTRLAALRIEQLRLASARLQLARADELAARAHSARVHAQVLAYQGVCEALAGNADAGIELAMNARTLAQDAALADLRTRIDLMLAALLARARRFDAASARLEEALAEARARHDRMTVRDSLRALSALETLRGRHERAFRALSEFASIDQAIAREQGEARVRALSLQLRVERERHDADIQRARNQALHDANVRLLAQRAELAARVAVAAGHPPPAPRADARTGLTARELTVLRLMARGRSNPQIAGDLGLSAHTVRGHVSTVLGKLGVPSRAAAVALAHRLGLLGAPA